MTLFSFIDIMLELIENASVAQSVVHLTRNEKVACSSQVTSSTNKRATRLGGSFLLISLIFERIVQGLGFSNILARNDQNMLTAFDHYCTITFGIGIQSVIAELVVFKIT